MQNSDAPLSTPRVSGGQAHPAREQHELCAEEGPEQAPRVTATGNGSGKPTSTRTAGNTPTSTGTAGNTRTPTPTGTGTGTGTHGNTSSGRLLILANAMTAFPAS